MTTYLNPQKAPLLRCARDLVFLTLGLSACGNTEAPAADLCTSLTISASVMQAVIYGDATWVGSEEAGELLSGPQLRAISAEVAVMRVRNLQGSHGAPLTHSSLVCDGEPLAEEVALAACSGVLVAPDVMLTARHCIESVSCEEMAVTTEFDVPVRAEDAWSFEHRRCTRVLAEDFDLDTAVVQLTPAFDDTVPVATWRATQLTETIPVILASHPLGTSTKVDLDAHARPSASGPDHMWFRGDAFNGSSGAGVFDEYGRIVGLITAGLSDFNYDRDAACMRIARSESEGFERLVSPIPVLHEACEVIPEHALCRRPFPSSATEPPQIEQMRCR